MKNLLVWFGILLYLFLLWITKDGLAAAILWIVVAAKLAFWILVLLAIRTVVNWLRK